MHDVGHGPFSHLFEREFLPQVTSGSHWYSSQFYIYVYFNDQIHLIFLCIFPHNFTERSFLVFLKSSMFHMVSFKILGSLSLLYLQCVIFCTL